MKYQTKQTRVASTLGIAAIFNLFIITAHAQKFEATENFSGSYFGIASATSVLPNYGKVVFLSTGPDLPIKAYKKLNNAPSLEFVDITSDLFSIQIGDGAIDITTPDLNGDGLPDLLYREPISTIFTWSHFGLPYLGTKMALFNPITGKFGNPAGLNNPNPPGDDEFLSAPQALDLNYDGLIDVVSAGADQTPQTEINIQVNTQFGSGQFNTLPTIVASIPTALTPETAPMLASGDINLDGVPDLVFTYRDSDTSTFPNSPRTSVVGYLSDATTQSYTLQQIAAINGAYPDAILIDDINNTQTDTLVVALRSVGNSSFGTSLPPNSFQLISWTFTGAQFTSAPLTTPIGHTDLVNGFEGRGVMKLKASDINSDNIKEIIATHYISGVRIFERSALGSNFTDVSSAYLPNQNNYSTAEKLARNSYDSRSHPFEVGDFSGDNKPDLLLPFTGAYGQALISTNAGYVDEAYIRGVKTFADNSDSFVSATCVAKFNQDQFDDLIKVDAEDTIRIQLGDGAGNFASVVKVTLPSPGAGLIRNATDCAAIDWDHDGDLDIAVTSGNGNFWIENRGAAAPTVRTLASPATVNFNARFVRVADFNLDTFPDILIASDHQLEILSGRAPATPRILLSANFGSNYTEEVLVQDIDLNGFPDIVLQQEVIGSPGSGDSVVLISNNGPLGTGPIAFTRATISLDAKAIAISDVDVDGFPEVAILTPFGSMNFFTVATGFTAPSVMQLSPNAAKILFKDLTGDSNPDLVTMGGTSPYIIEMHERQIGGFSLPRSLGIPNQVVKDIEVSDFDLDGDSDLLISSNANPLFGPISGGIEITQSKLYRNLARDFRASSIVRPTATAATLIDLAVQSDDFVGTLAIVFASLDPLSPGIQTQFGLARLTNFVVGPSLLTSAPYTTSVTQVPLPNATAFIGQSISLQALLINLSGSTTLSNAQSVQIKGP